MHYGSSSISMCKVMIDLVNTGWLKKKGNPILAAILKYFLEVINFSVYIQGESESLVPPTFEKSLNKNPDVLWLKYIYG